MSNSPLRWILIVVVLLAGLVIGGWYGPGLLIKANATADWPTVQGEVVECGTEAPAKSGQSWHLALFYRYELDGAVYRSNRWNVHGTRKLDGRGEAEALARNYAPGDAITVHYDPENPSNAVLEPGGSGEAWLVIGLGVLIAIFATRIAARRLLARR